MDPRIVRSLPLIIVAVLASGTAGAVDVGSTVQFGGHYYYVHPVGGMNWLEARDASLQESLDLGGTVLPGHLLTINSAAEQAFVSATFLTTNWRQTWLGAYQYCQDGGPADFWAWVTEEDNGNLFTDWSYQFMDSGEPSNSNIGEDTLRSLINGGSGQPPGTGNDRWHDFHHLDNNNGSHYLLTIIEFDGLEDQFAGFDACAPAVPAVEGAGLFVLVALSGLALAMAVGMWIRRKQSVVRP